MAKKNEVILEKRTIICSPEFTGYLDEAPQELIDKLEAKKVEPQEKLKPKHEVELPDVSE